MRCNPTPGATAREREAVVEDLTKQLAALHSDLSSGQVVSVQITTKICKFEIREIKFTTKFAIREVEHEFFYEIKGSVEVVSQACKERKAVVEDLTKQLVALRFDMSSSQVASVNIINQICKFTTKSAKMGKLARVFTINVGYSVG